MRATNQRAATKRSSHRNSRGRRRAKSDPSTTPLTYRKVETSRLPTPLFSSFSHSPPRHPTKDGTRSKASALMELYLTSSASSPYHRHHSLLGSLKDDLSELEVGGVLPLGANQLSVLAETPDVCACFHVQSAMIQQDHTIQEMCIGVRRKGSSGGAVKDRLPRQRRAQSRWRQCGDIQRTNQPRRFVQDRITTHQRRQWQQLKRFLLSRSSLLSSPSSLLPPLFSLLSSPSLSPPLPLSSSPTHPKAPRELSYNCCNRYDSLPCLATQQQSFTPSTIGFHSFTVVM